MEKKKHEQVNNYNGIFGKSKEIPKDNYDDLLNNKVKETFFKEKKVYEKKSDIGMTEQKKGKSGRPRRSQIIPTIEQINAKIDYIGEKIKEHEYVSIYHLAQIIGLKYASIYQWIKKGIPHKFSGKEGDVRFVGPHDKVVEWMKNNVIPTITTSVINDIESDRVLE